MILRARFLSALIGLALLLAMTRQVEKSKSIPADSVWNPQKIPYQIGDWQGDDLPGLGIRSRDVLRLDSYVRRRYRDSQRRELVLYAAYWRTQGGDYQASKHSPRVCLPANGWNLLSANQISLSQNSSQRVPMNQLLASIDAQRVLFTYTFFTDERMYSDEWRSFYELARSAFLRQRTDGGIIEVSVPLRNDLPAAEAQRQAEQSSRDFLDTLLPILSTP